MNLRSTVVAALLVAAPARAADAPATPPPAEHRIFSADKISWVAAPNSLPAGARMAVLQGDPTQAGLFTMRVFLPAGYAVQPHFHPADENVTVISGVIHMGVGDHLDAAKSHPVNAGDFSVMPAGLHHFVWTTEGAVIQVHGMGPWGITYVNPEDDPRGPPPAK